MPSPETFGGGFRLESPSGGPKTKVESKERKGPKVVVYAGESPKRKELLEYLFPSPDTVDSRPGGRENQLKPVSDIAGDKIAFVFRNNPDVRNLITNNPSNILIATDVKTNPLQRYTGAIISTTKERGKPLSVGEVWKTFKRIARAADEDASGLPPFYRIDSGTVIMQKDGIPRKKPDSVTASLDADVIRYYATVKGFDEYQEAFKRFYRTSHIYGDESDHIPNITQIAGGLSFGVLVNQGAITEVDGVPRYLDGQAGNKVPNPEFRGAVKKGLYTALFGFDVDLLRQFDSEIEQKIQTYEPLERVTALAMGEIELLAA